MDTKPNAPVMYPSMQSAYMPDSVQAAYAQPIAKEPSANVLQSPPVVMVSNNATPPLGPKPQCMTCPYCATKMLTRIKYRANRRTHAFATVFCVTLLLCLVPLPYCLKSCKSMDHYCTSCNQFVGQVAS